MKNSYGSGRFLTVLLLTKPNECCPQVLRRKVDSGDWMRLRDFMQLTWDDVRDLSIDDVVTYFAAFLIDAVLIRILHTLGSASKRRIPWWIEDCKEVRRRQNKACCLLRDSPTAENIISFKHVKFEGRRTRSIAKSESWQKYISDVNLYKQETKVWNRVTTVLVRPSHHLPLVDDQGIV